MSFSSQDTQAQPPAKPKNFGDALGDYAKSRLPIAGGLLSSLMGGGNDRDPNEVGPDYTQQNQQPLRQTGLPSLLIKLLGGGG